MLEAIAAGPPPLGLYRGWRVIIGTLIIAILSVGVTTYVFGLFVVPASHELHVSRTDANVMLIMVAIGSTLLAPIAGWLIDRFPAPIVLAGGALALTAGLLTIAAASAPRLIAAATLVLVSTGIICCGSIVVSTVATRWFRRRLGRVLGIVATAGTAGGVFVPPLAGLLLARMDWRQALATLAVCFCVIALLACRFLVTSRPAPGELERWGEADLGSPYDSGASSGPAWRYGTLLCNRIFWLVALSTSLLLANLYAIVVMLAPSLIDGGTSVQSAALMISLLTASAVCGKLLTGFLSERVDMRLLMLGCVLAHLMMLIALTLQPGYGVLLAACAVTGLGIGGVLPLQARLIDFYFGKTSYGMVMGLMGLIYQPFSVAATGLVAAMRDRTGSYGSGFASLMAGIGVALLLVLLLPARKAAMAQMAEARA